MALGELSNFDAFYLTNIDQNLLPPEAQQSILLHHLPTHIVLLTRSATIAFLNLHNLNDNARQMGCLGHRAGIIHGRLLGISNMQVPLLEDPTAR